MYEDLISVIEVARQTGKRKQSIFKVLKRLGIEPQKAVGADSKGQVVSYISLDEYERVQSELAAASTSGDAEFVAPSLFGYFYLIQLEPDHDPGRFKVGFAANVDERLRSHRTSAPLCKLIKAWPCRSLWEKTAIESVSQGCERIHTEVFRAESLSDIEDRCERFFAVMPPLAAESIESAPPTK